MCIIKHQLHVITVIHTNVFMIFIIQPMLYTQEQVFFLVPTMEKYMYMGVNKALT